MSPRQPFNVVIVGVGGQGIATLARTLWLLSDRRDLRCQGSIVKGGAQRLGSVTASLRIFAGGEADYGCFSTEIPAGSLDLLIGLEPWEALRSAYLCNAGTRLIVNREKVPLMSARSHKISIQDPVRAMLNVGLHPLTDDYTSRATSELGSPKMLNYLIGREAIRSAMQFFELDQFDECFRAVRSGGSSEVVRPRPG